MKAATLNPITSIDGIEKLRGMVNERVSRLGWEMEVIAEEWQGIGMAGGQREDHAAMLMGRLRSHLAEISRFCNTVEQQIDGMIADPFGRNE